MGKITKTHVNNFEYNYENIFYYNFFATYARGVVLTYMESETCRLAVTLEKSR